MFTPRVGVSINRYLVIVASVCVLELALFIGRGDVCRGVFIRAGFTTIFGYSVSHIWHHFLL